MEKVYEVCGLDCANCAAQLERKIQKSKLVKSVSINFLTSKMRLDCLDENFAKVTEICANFEDGVTLEEIE